MERHTMTVKEASSYLGVHPDTIYCMVQENRIPHLRLQRRILFTKASIDLWIQDQTKIRG